MTVGRLKELMTGINDSADVTLWVGDWGLVPCRETEVRNKCYECVDGKFYLPDSKVIECPHCKGTGKHLQLILGD